ncbi:MAG TPA: T9SS type A sorting domain-containing protein [Ignavibacteriales bacterium]|nr:T9SS type A sorting domain-containing protein [Ignavibacteriales bacterium]HPD67119.1 T9SS type A sorting domain-containing protein [Ignavibacteriales bacterium]HRR19555.1 T9SS type A sorting domain-containing protein [Ignavibacteriales bacterium]
MMSRALPTSKTKVGVKFNKEVYSLNSFDWFPEYDTMALAQRDSMYWDYATNNQINTYNNMPSSDGQVVLVYFDNIDIPTNESYEVIYAYAIASTEDSVKTMLDEAATKFNELTRVEKIDTKVTNFELYQNYPNPFNPATNIKFAIVQNDFVTLTVYNSLGQEIAQLVNENLSAGTYNVKFDANNLPSGIYYYQLKTSNNQLTKKMMLIK